MEAEIVTNKASSKAMMERRARPPEQLNCPRCNSTNTKFCYYNNYSLTQPRYFCKTCRRYWTEGGSLRNVPIGGGSRKNKRPATSTAPSSPPSKIPDLNPSSVPHFSSQNPTIHKGRDLNLVFPEMSEGSPGLVHSFLQVPKLDNGHCNQQNIIASSSYSSPISAMEFLRTGTASRSGFDSFLTAPLTSDYSNILYPHAFSLHDYYKPNLGFSIDGVGSRSTIVHGGMQDQTDHQAGRLFFPLTEAKPPHPSGERSEADQNKSHGYWNNGVLGGGSW